MPLNAGDTRYGTVPGAGLSASMGASESAPLLIPEPEPEPGQQWQPLTVEELEVAAGGPGWRKVRCYLVLLFWLAWVAMLATSIAIVVTSPRPVLTPLRWWQKSLFYQLQPDMLTEKQTDGSDGINGEERPVSVFKKKPPKNINQQHFILDKEGIHSHFYILPPSGHLDTLIHVSLLRWPRDLNALTTKPNGETQCK